MDVKKKLVELLRPWLAHLSLAAAKDLIANGVTVQGDELPTNCKQLWIPASEPPKEDQRVLVWVRSKRNKTVMVDTDRVHNGKWVRWGDCVTHWVPICMPEPPKGE